MDTYEIVILVLTVVLILVGGYARRVVKELKDLVDVTSLAIQDNKITRHELKDILKEGADVKTAFIEIASLFSKKPS